LQLAIFDCDGVLVDSELLACRIVAEQLTEAGFAITTEYIMENFVGVADSEMYPLLKEKFGQPIPDELRERIMHDVTQTLARELEPTVGIHKAVQAISLRKCVASSSNARRVRQSLARTGLLDFFEPHIFTADQVARGKPAPDLFLFAAAQLGVAPSECLVIEDSRAGVQAAVAAGMRALGYTGAGHCGTDHGRLLQAAGAARVFSAMQDLPALLQDMEV
jgi:HAD superfamily hydrolase (TIGR01509 family)